MSLGAFFKNSLPLLARKVASTNRISVQMISLSSINSHHDSAIIQVDDLTTKKEERSENEKLRCKLAATYRLVDYRKWSWNIYNHITIRSNDNPDHFFINPFGLFYSEITASSLLKIDSKCNIIEQGSTTYGLNKAGFTLHSWVHGARKDINAVIHLHTGIAAGISTLKCGLMPISQEALICGEVSYNDYEGILVDEAMGKKIISDLGPKNKILILRNHGIAFCGSTIEEAYFWLINFMTACDIQFHALAASNGQDNVYIPPDNVVQQVKRVISGLSSVNEKSADNITWQVGELEMEAEMRNLDRLGYNTGYPFKKNFK